MMPLLSSRLSPSVADVMAAPLLIRGSCTLQEAFSAPHGGPAASQPAPLGDDSATVARLCDLMSVFLHHGLVPSPPGCASLLTT